MALAGSASARSVPVHTPALSGRIGVQQQGGCRAGQVPARGTGRVVGVQGGETIEVGELCQCDFHRLGTARQGDFEAEHLTHYQGQPVEILTLADGDVEARAGDRQRLLLGAAKAQDPQRPAAARPAQGQTDGGSARRAQAQGEGLPPRGAGRLALGHVAPDPEAQRAGDLQLAQPGGFGGAQG